jgi:hypothetical protein
MNLPNVSLASMTSATSRSLERAALRHLIKDSIPIGRRSFSAFGTTPRPTSQFLGVIHPGAPTRWIDQPMSLTDRHHEPLRVQVRKRRVPVIRRRIGGDTFVTIGSR